MALTASIKVDRRGPARGASFGYPPAPGETIWGGSLCVVNASNQLQRIQTAGGVAFVGMATAPYNNSASAAAGPTNIVCANDEMALTVPGATAANINAPVYATDDGTLTLTQPTTGFEGKIGNLIGIENGQTYVKVQGY